MKKNIKKITINGQTYNYVHHKKDIVSFTMRVRDNMVHVSTPFRYNEKQFDKFLKSRILKYFKHIDNRYDNYSFKSKPGLYLFGEKVTLDIEKEDNREKIHVMINDDGEYFDFPSLCNSSFLVIIKTPKRIDEKKIIHNLYKKIISQYNEIYFNYAQKIAHSYNRKIKKLVFKDLKGSWGLCKYERKEIVISKKLFHYPFRMQSYVIIHEIAHLVEPNHSSRFWMQVEKLCPQYKIIRKELKW